MRCSRVIRLSVLVAVYGAFIIWGTQYRLVILLLSLASALILGRLWCGYACPVGLLQELMSLVRKRTGLPTLHGSPKMRRALDVTKWVVLAAFIAAVVLLGLRPSMYIRPDQLVVDAGGILGTILVGVFMGFGLVQERFFCKVCPLGTLRGIFSRGSLSRIRKDPQACTHCRTCLESCPMDIKPIYEERRHTDVTHVDCIYCMKCIEACPEPGALSFTLAGKRILVSKRQGTEASHD